MENSPILRKRLDTLLSILEFISLVSFIEEISTVPDAVSELAPDLIIIDIDLPSRAYFKMLEQINNEYIQVKVIVITETIEPRYIRQFKNSGAGMVFNKVDGLNKFIAHLNILNREQVKIPVN
jgi:DNA-binding NarL/FixJ family response regulator